MQVDDEIPLLLTLIYLFRCVERAGNTASFWNSRGPPSKGRTPSYAKDKVMWGVWLVRMLCGNTNEPGDVGMNPWKSSLFFLTDRGPEIGLSRERAVCLAEQLTLRAVRCVLDDP